MTLLQAIFMFHRGSKSLKVGRWKEGWWIGREVQVIWEGNSGGGGLVCAGKGLGKSKWAEGGEDWWKTVKERPSEKRWRAEIANQQEFFPLIRAEGCATRPQNSTHRCKFAACESVMNSLMKWVWRLRVTRWVRCHFHGGVVQQWAMEQGVIMKSQHPACHHFSFSSSWEAAPTARFHSQGSNI